MPSLKSDKTRIRGAGTDSRNDSRITPDTKVRIQPKMEKINRDTLIDTLEYTKSSHGDGDTYDYVNTKYMSQDEEGNRYDLTTDQTKYNSSNTSDDNDDDYIQKYINDDENYTSNGFRGYNC